MKLRSFSALWNRCTRIGDYHDGGIFRPYVAFNFHDFAVVEKIKSPKYMYVVLSKIEVSRTGVGVETS